MNLRPVKDPAVPDDPERRGLLRLPGQLHHRLNMRIIVQTHFKVFFDNRELEFDGLKPLAVGLLAFARKTIAGSTEIAN